LSTVVVGSVLSLGLVACGGTSKADFAKNADPVCATANSELATVTKPTTFKQLGEMSGKVAAATDKQVQALRGLDQPKDGKSELVAVLTAMEGTTAAAKKVEAGVTADDGRVVEAGAGELRQAAANADDGARSYGLTQCGKGGRDAATNIADTSNPLLKQQLITKAEAICKEASGKLDKLPERPDTPQGLVRSVNEGLPIVEKAVLDLKALHAPASDKATYDEFLTSNDRVVDLARDLRDAATAANASRLLDLAGALENASLEISRKATAFGLKECAFEE
jgi:hypothetical protein